MSVLIRGMDKLPEDGAVLVVRHDGDGKAYIKYAEIMGYRMELVELPEKHGRLVEFIDVATTTDEDTGTETVNLGEAFAAYFKMRESKPVIKAEGEG